jgi:hypothetical protein
VRAHRQQLAAAYARLVGTQCVDVVAAVDITHYLHGCTCKLMPLNPCSVDSYGRAQVKGTHKEGCASQTYFMASNGLLCPR